MTVPNGDGNYAGEHVEIFLSTGVVQELHLTLESRLISFSASERWTEMTAKLADLGDQKWLFVVDDGGFGKKRFQLLNSLHV